MVCAHDGELHEFLLVWQYLKHCGGDSRETFVGVTNDKLELVLGFHRGMYAVFPILSLRK